MSAQIQPDAAARRFGITAPAVAVTAHTDPAADEAAVMAPPTYGAVLPIALGSDRESVNTPLPPYWPMGGDGRLEPPPALFPRVSEAGGAPGASAPLVAPPLMSEALELESALLECFLCPVSLQPMRYPYTVGRCGHSFDAQSVVTFMSTHGLNAEQAAARRRCPTCRNAVRWSDIQPNRLAQSAVNLLFSFDSTYDAPDPIRAWQERTTPMATRGAMPAVAAAGAPLFPLRLRPESQGPHEGQNASILLNIAPETQVHQAAREVQRVVGLPPTARVRLMRNGRPMRGRETLTAAGTRAGTADISYQVVPNV